MQIEELIIGQLEGARDKIRANMEEKKINATGRTSLSVRVRQEGSTYMLVGGGDSQQWGGRTAPFETVEIGRAPGGDYKTLRPAIYFWTIAKDIATEDDSHRWAIATNIAKRIVNEGTARHRSHEDVYSTVVKETADEIRKALFKDVNTLMLGAISSKNVTTNTNL